MDKFTLPEDPAVGFFRNSPRHRLRRMVVCRWDHTYRHGCSTGRRFCKSCEVKHREGDESYYDVVKRMHAWYAAHPEVPRTAPQGSVGERRCLLNCGWVAYGPDEYSTKSGPSRTDHCPHEWGPFRYYADRAA